MSVTEKSAETITGGAASAASPADYIALMKPRVMTLVVFTGFAGLVAAPVDMSFISAAIAIFALALGAGAAGAFNMAYDSDIDAVMRRTRLRPVVRGIVPRAEAYTFGGVFTLASVTLMALAANYVAAALLAFSIFFYALIYTVWLKRSTPQNIVIGGAAGAFPPMIGWAAATGSVSLDAVILFAIIFLWTPPPFLGAGALQVGRLRGCENPHDAGGEGGCVHAPPDHDLCDCLCSDQSCAAGHRAGRHGLCRRGHTGRCALPGLVRAGADLACRRGGNGRGRAL